ncbi:MAG: sulfatase-like hydrolase/transferase, partial [Candidatus Cryptobacteroides sp.]
MKTDRRIFNTASKMFAANLALVYASDGQASEKKSQDRPNVVFVLIDDMGWRDLGCFGSDFYETPNIDRMADEGMRFTSAYASCHVSSPSRASIMTGMYPASLGLTDWLPGRREYDFQRYSTTRVTQDLPHEAETIAETLRSNGYRTALIGKWHLGETGSVPQEHGFDIHIPDGYLRGWPDTYYAPFGMNGYDGKEGDYLTDCMTDEAVKYIKDNYEAPFFLMLSHFAVHDPVQGRPDLVKKYMDKLKSMPESDIAPYILEGNPDDSNALSKEDLEKFLDNPVYSSHR